jgi:hypothetical protein
MGNPARRAVAIGLAWLAALTVMSGAGARSLAERAPVAPSPAPSLADPVACPGCWHPAIQVSWQWQLRSPPKPADLLDVRMYDVDVFESSASLVDAMHARGIKAVCYLSAGAWEGFRPDADRFPEEVLGDDNGWPGERWLDIRRLDVLGPIMRARLDRCEHKGFDGVEFDNVDGYANDTGFPLTGADQLRFNVFLANQAHRRGLTTFLKNDLGQIGKLLPYFDAALNEQCHQYHECGTLDAFVEAGKPVFGVEYELETSRFCPAANAHDFNFLRKRLALGVWRRPCRGG